MRFKLICLLCFLSQFSVAANASDIEREKRLASEVVDSIMDGDAEFLSADGHEFLAIYTEADEAKGGVVIMHGRGFHPNWSDVAYPLRVGLPERGWNTLSIQMPILPNEAEYPEYAPLYDEVAPRVDAAIKYLQANGSSNIVLIGHSQGAAMTAYYLSTSKQDVNGFVAIGMGSFADDPRMNSIKALEKINVPVLDLYGGEDLENILKSSGARADSAKKAGNRNYTQVKLSGANHFFDGKEDELVESVAGWLDKLTAK